MADYTINEVFALPAGIPRCIVKIQDFDDQDTLQENIRDYVITETVANEMERLVDRILASCVRQEAGEGLLLDSRSNPARSPLLTSPRKSSSNRQLRALLHGGREQPTPQLALPPPRFHHCTSACG